MPNISEYLENIENAILGEDVRDSIHDAIEVMNTVVDQKSAEIDAKVGVPFTAATAADMTDTDKIYVYTGEETGYETGHWYYYDGTEWVRGGAFNSPQYDYDDLYNKPPIVLVDDDEPEDDRTNIWFDTTETDEIEVPTMEEFEELEEEIGFLKDNVGDGRLFEHGAESTSEYYKGFSKLKQGVKYKLKVTAHTTGTYTLASSTVATSSGLIDTIASSVAFIAETPLYFYFTPSADAYFLRLFACGNWDVDAFETEKVWSAIENLEEQGNSSETAIERGFNVVSNKNRLDISSIIEGKRYNTNGALVDTSSFVTTAPIPLEEGETVYFSLEENGVRYNTGMWYLAFFSTDKSTVLDYTNEGVTSYTAASDGLLCFSFKLGTKSDFFCGDVSDPGYFDEYGYSYIAKQTSEFKPYKDVVWACVGDSMTATGTSAKKHYYNYIAEELGFIIQNYGVSGTGYAAQMANNKAFYQRIANITDDFDVLTIFGSVNDLSVDLPLGTYSDNDTTTIGGCINAAIDAFYTLAPFKKLGIISQPPSVGTVPNGNCIGTEAQDYNDLLEQICKNRGIPFLNLFNCSGLRPWNSAYRVEYYNEDGVQDTGVHPNSKGQKQISTKIREFIKTII